MSKNQNTVKSQDNLNPCNDGKRKTDVLISAIENCEKLEKENKKLREELKHERKCRDNSIRNWYKRCKEWFWMCVIVNLLWFCWSLYLIFWG